MIEIWKHIQLKKAHKIEIHSNLLGSKQALLQYLHSFYLADIEARSSLTYAKLTAFKCVNFTRARDLLKRNEEEASKYVNQNFTLQYEGSPDFREALRSRERSEDIALRIGDLRERFYTIIGQVKSSFEDQKIENFVTDIKKAEEILGAFDKDISKALDELDHEIGIEFNSVCIDKSDKKKYKYSDYPNIKRDLLFVEKLNKLKTMKKLLNSDAEAKIDILDSKITDLYEHLEKKFVNNWSNRECKIFCSSNICPLKPLSQEGAKGKG
ncbi:Uncharacterised protein [uncultured archaeon]|nr:Uncharacterised protein [uncultured archaeon]